MRIGCIQARFPREILIPWVGTKVIRFGLIWYVGNRLLRIVENYSHVVWIKIDGKTQANAYVFGEKILDQKYKHAVLETIAGVQRTAPDFPCAEAFAIVYDGTPEGSPARRLLVDMYAYGAFDAPDWSTEFEALPHEALADVMRATVKVRRENPARPWTESLEAYEENKKG
jgi:hypothetical protein